MKITLEINDKIIEWMRKVEEKKVEEIIEDAITGYFENLLDVVTDEWRKWSNDEEVKQIINEMEQLSKQTSKIITEVSIQRG